MFSFWIRFKYFFDEILPWFIAYNIPRKIALLCFVRVYSTLGSVSNDYEVAYDNWEKGIGR